MGKKNSVRTKKLHSIEVIFFFVLGSNVCFIKNRTKHSSKILLSLVRFLSHQTLFYSVESQISILLHKGREQVSVGNYWVFDTSIYKSTFSKKKFAKNQSCFWPNLQARWKENVKNLSEHALDYGRLFFSSIAYHSIFHEFTYEITSSEMSTEPPQKKLNFMNN